MSITFKELYPEHDGDNSGYSFYGPGGYQPILESIGEIITQEDEDDYQGSSWVLYEGKEGHKFGYLDFGWGSCSGCDALQDCRSEKEVLDLRDSMENDITWFDSKEEAITYFKTHDFEGEWYADKEEFVKFREDVLKHLKETI